MKVTNISPIVGELVRVNTGFSDNADFDDVYLFMQGLWFKFVNNKPVMVEGDCSDLYRAYHEFKQSRLKKPFSYE
jgi:hypothetical protein